MDHNCTSETHGSAAVVTVSDRVAQGQRSDVSGPAAVLLLREARWSCSDAIVIPDGASAVRSAIVTAIRTGADVVLTLGGTGITPRDQTPEGTADLLSTELPGVAEAIRAQGRRSVLTAVLSRGLAGVASVDCGEMVRRAIVVNLAGSPGAVTDAFEILGPVLPHALSQLSGGDH